MAFDFSNITDEELEAMAAQSAPASEPMPQKPLSEWTDEELEAYASEPTPAPVQSAAHSPRMTREERIAANNRAIETARSQENPGFLSVAGDALAEGAKGAARAVKSIGSGIVGMASGAVRLAGTPVRLATGWEGLHRLADTIDSSYENFGADALMSEYGENPDGWGYALGRAGEKVAGVAGSLAALGGVGKAVGAAGTALKAAGHAKTAAAVANTLPLMFGNDAAVRAYDTARANGKSKGESAALAALNGAIHFFGFKAFENQSLKKMLNIGPEVEVMMPKWADALAEEGGQSFSSLVRGTRNGMVKYIAAENGKRALKAGGIMGLQDMLSDPVMQVAEGASIDDIDFSRMLKAGAHGVGEGALMEGLTGGAAIFRSQKAAEKFMADKYFRGKDYKVMGADGKMHDEPGLLNTSEGRMVLMKQNPDATERVLDIVEHGGTPRPAELDAAFLPPDMTAEELKKFASDWRNDLKPYVDEAWAADAPRQTAAPDAAEAEPGRDMLSPEEAQSQQKAMNDAAEAKRVYDKAHGEVSIDDYNEWNDLYRRGVINMSFDEWLATKEQRESTPRLRAPTLEEVADDLARRAPEPDEPIKVSPLPERTPEDFVPADDEVRTSDAASTQAQSLRDQIQRRVESERQAEVGRKVQKELDNFSNAVKNHMDVFNNEAFGRENAELLQAVEDAIRKNNPQLVKEGLNKLKNKVRRFANRNALTPKTGGTDETGSVRDETPAQPEQGEVVAPPAGAEARPVESAEARAEAADARVVEQPAVWPNGWDNAGEEIKGYVVPNDGDVAPGREVAIAHRSGGSINAPQKIKGVVESVDGDKVKVYYRDGMGYGQHDTFKKSELVGVMPLTAVPTEGATSQTAQNRIEATQEGAGARPASETATTTPAPVKPAEAPSRTSGAEGAGAPPAERVPDGKGESVKPKGKNAVLEDEEYISNGQKFTIKKGQESSVRGAWPDDVVAYDEKGNEVARTSKAAGRLSWAVERIKSEIDEKTTKRPTPAGKGKSAKPKAAESDYGVTMFEEPAVDGEGVSYVVKDGPSDAHRMMFKSKAEAEARLGKLRAERKAIKESPLATLADGTKVHLLKTDEGWIPYDENYNDLRHGLFKAAKTKAGAIKVAEKGVKWAKDVAEFNSAYKMFEEDFGLDEFNKKVGWGNENGEGWNESAALEHLRQFDLEKLKDMKERAKRFNLGHHNGRNEKIQEWFDKVISEKKAPVPDGKGKMVKPEKPVSRLSGEQWTKEQYEERKNLIATGMPVSVAGFPKGEALAVKRDRNWVVIDGKSGLRFGIGRTRKDAIADAETNLKNHTKEQIRQAREMGSSYFNTARDAYEPKASDLAADAELRKGFDKTVKSALSQEGRPIDNLHDAAERLIDTIKDKYDGDANIEKTLDKALTDFKENHPLGRGIKPSESAEYFKEFADELAKKYEIPGYDGKVEAPKYGGREMKVGNVDSIQKKLFELRGEYADTSVIEEGAFDELPFREIDAKKLSARDLKELKMLEKEANNALFDIDVDGIEFEKSGVLADESRKLVDAYTEARDNLNRFLEQADRYQRLKRDKEGRPLFSWAPEGDLPDLSAEPPAAEPKSNRLRRADGTDPLAEKNPAPKTMRKAVDKISLAIGNRTGTGVVTPEEADGIVRGIVESPETKHNRYRDFFNPLENDAKWHESLGLDAESAKNIRDAVDRVKADADLKKWFPQVDAAVKKANDGKLSKKDAAPLFGKISEGLEKAERMGLSETANRLREAAEVIRPVAETVEQGDVNKFNYSTKGKKLNNRLGGTDKRGGKTVSLDTKNGTVDVGADGKGGSLAGNRHLIIDSVDGDNLTVTMKDAAGKTLATRKMNRAQWSALSQGAVATDGDPANPQKGDLIRMSRNGESSTERDLRFASDENYQKWLRSRKANDAEPLRERYEQEQAKAAKSIARNTLPGVDVEIVDRAFNPETDGGNRQLLDGEGRVVGTFDRSTNKVTLYRGASAATLVHELGGHATLRFAEQEAERGNRQLLDRINRAIDEAPQALKDEIRSRYPGVDETALRDEIWAALRERNSPAMEKAIKTLQGKAWYNRAWSAFRDAWKGLLARMGFNRADLSQIDRMSNDEFLSRLDRIMSDGKTLGRLEAMGEGPAPADASTGSPTVREARSPRPAGSRIMDDQQTKGEKFMEKSIDSLAPVKSVQDELGGVKEITRADGYTDHMKSTDLVAAKDKANGRLEYEVRQHQFRVDDINRDLSRAALPKQSTEDLVDDFNLYLQCKHAPERNLSVAQDRGDAYTPDYSEGMGQITLPGGNRIGLSENVANRLLKGLRGKYGLKFKMFENAADKVYKMLEADLDRRFDAGRLSAEDYAFYKTRWHGPGGADGKWAHYVPLKTDMERLEPEALNSSTAGMKRNEFMKAQGRGTGDIADSPLAAAVLQTEQGIRGSIKNEVANVEANLVEHAQKQGIPIAEIVPGDEIRRGRTYSFTFADGETVDASGSMRLVENHPEIHLFKRDGKLYAIRYDKGANGRGLAFAKAASGENMGRWGSGLEWIPRMTHWMSAMRTQWSPEFTVSNWLADHLEAAQALVGRYGLKEGGKAFAKTIASEIQNWKDLRAYLKDGTANGYIKEFVEGGGLTKGGVASEGFDSETQKIRSKIEQFRRKQKQWREMSLADLAKSLGRNVTDFLSFANELAEYSTRTGLYTALRKQGVPQAEAIKFARDATVNFNRKGTAMPYINGLYMFANASVQGAVRSVQAMRDTHGKELVAALTAIGVAKAVIDNYLGNDDEREAAGGRNARNQSEYDKKHNVGVPIGGGRQIVPLRFRGPYAAVPYLAQTAANVAMGVTSPEDGAKTLVRELGDQVTDIVGGNGIMNDRGELDGSLIGQSIAPSVADPIVQLATGKDYKGDERRRKSFDKTMPASSNGKRNTGGWYKVAAQTLNRMSGGNEHRKGLVDVAPEDLQLVLEFLGGAPMRDFNNVVSSANNAIQLASGGTPERTLSQIPFVRRVVREYPESTSRYYDALEDYERDKAEFKKTTPERRREMKADKPYLFVGKSLLDGQIEQVKKYMHLERGEVKVGQKWVEPKTPRTEEQKEKYRKLRLEMQARVLKRLGE